MGSREPKRPLDEAWVDKLIRDSALAKAKIAPLPEKQSEPLVVTKAPQRNSNPIGFDQRQAIKAIKAKAPRVRAQWPMFSIGGRYTFTIQDEEVTLRLIKAHGQDFLFEHIHGTIKTLCEFSSGDHEFRIRTCKGSLVCIRPVKGQAHNYIQRSL